MTRRNATRLAAAAAATTLLTALALPLTIATPAAATTLLTVTTTNDVVDSGDGLLSLREAVDLANAAGEAAEIVLAPAATYQLTICPAAPVPDFFDDDTNATDDLDLTSSYDVTITGNGATVTQACADGRHLHWAPVSSSPLLTITDTTFTGATNGLGAFSILAMSSLTLDGVIIDNNMWWQALGGEMGGAVGTLGTGTLTVAHTRISRTRGAAIDDRQTGPPVTITDSVLTDNWGASQFGADATAVYVEHRDLHIVDSTISENRPESTPLPHPPVDWDEFLQLEQLTHNGAIAVPEHNVTLSNSTVHHNAGQVGGAVRARQVTIEGSTISENIALGGGVVASKVTVTDSTFSDNSSYLPGSDFAIYNNFSGPSLIADSTLSNGYGVSIFTDSELRLLRSTITGHTPTEEGPRGGHPTAIDASDDLTILESTISGNQLEPTPPAYADASEISFTGHASLTVRNSVLGSATSTVPVCVLDGGATVVSQGHNFDSDGTCGLSDPSDVSNGGDPLLGALADNGGVTETMVPLPGSPLVDAVPAPAAGCVGETSQNGLVLPQGLGCEIGAAEVPSTARLAGHVTSASTGLPLAGIEVRVRSLANTNVATTTTGADGTWTVAGLAAGDYKVLFRDPTGEHNQTFNGSAWPFSAAPAVTVAGDHTTVVDQALTVDNAITGTVTDTQTGLPVAGVQVRVRTAANTYIRTATTNAAGTYTIADLAPGDYKLLFRDPTGAHEQTFNSSAWPFSAAPTITVTDTTITIDQAMVPIPAIDGTVTQDGTGTPLAGIDIRVRTLDNTYLGSATTGPDGTWTIHLPAGTYKIRYSDPTGTHQTEFHDNKPGFTTATPITHTPTGTTLTASLAPTP